MLAKNPPPKVIYLKGRSREHTMRGKPKPMASYQKGGVVKGFKPCPGCPSLAKCRAAGRCAKAGKK